MPLRKVVPPLTKANQIPPPFDYDFFESSQEFPFHPHAVDYDAVNAAWLMDAALLVYGKADFIQQRIAALVERLPGLSTRLFAGKSTQALALTSSDFVILSFRGTRIEVYPDWISRLECLFSPAKKEIPPSGRSALHSWRDIVTDAKFWLSADGIHTGFRQAYHQPGIRDEIRQFLGTIGDRPVWVTGHSLGGAIATIAAVDLRECCSVQGLYTFGSPRVGNRNFIAQVPPNAFRFVNYRDLVTHLPLRFGGYEHVGTTKHIGLQGTVGDEHSVAAPFLMQIVELISNAIRLSAKGAFADVGNPRAFIRRRRQFENELPDCFLTDHAPVYYASHLWNALPTADLKNDQTENHDLH